MRIIKTADYEAMSKRAAGILAAQITLKPDSVLGLATGSTPEGLYKVLVEMYMRGELDFSQIHSVNLDEYRGIAHDNDQSYRYFMKKHLFDHVNIQPDAYFVPDGECEDPEKACADHEAVIAKLGGVDMQLLGIGNNGHIGFNEPGTEFAKDTHCIKLSESTIQANARFFASKEEVPKEAYTMGIGTIMRARKILLVANGEKKAEALYRACCGPITPEVPASILQLHPDVTVVADEAAVSLFNGCC